jgi:hypothetical protein
MWWPAVGGLFVGIGGVIFPPALGVGYDNIALLLKGNVAIHFMLGILIVKSLIWVISLGSGTSGGVLAPLLMMGAALGGLEGLFLPHFGSGFWPLVAMGAILGGTMRSPFTGIVFSIELTHDLNMLLPLLVACFLAHAFTVLTLKRSILTEKIARRGYHLSREYALDPLEILFVREVMQTSGDAAHVYPPTSQSGTPVFAYSDEPLRVIVYRMAETGSTRLPVVDRDRPERVIGSVSLDDLLQARTRNLVEERARERVLHLRFPSRHGKLEEVPADISTK